MLVIVALTWWVAAANPYAKPAPAPAPEADPLVWIVPAVEFLAGDTGSLRATLAVPGDGWTIYQDMLEVEVIGEVGELSVSPAVIPLGSLDLTGDNKSADRRWYASDITVNVPLTSTDVGLTRIKLHTRHQACKGGVCFQPRELTHEVWVNVAQNNGK